MHIKKFLDGVPVKINCRFFLVRGKNGERRGYQISPAAQYHAYHNTVKRPAKKIIEGAWLWTIELKKKTPLGQTKSSHRQNLPYPLHSTLFLYMYVSSDRKPESSSSGR